jgi:hypothetical protein
VEGTLEIDGFDSGLERRVWRGVGTVDIQSESQAEALAGRAVAAILADFPAQESEPASSR